MLPSYFFYFSHPTFTPVLLQTCTSIQHTLLSCARIIQHTLVYLQALVFLKCVVVSNIDHATEK